MKDELQNRLKEKDMIVKKYLEQFASNYHLSDYIMDKISTDTTAYDFIERNSSNGWEKFMLEIHYRDCKYNYSQQSIGDETSMFQKPSIMELSNKITSCSREVSCKPKTLADTQLNDECEWNYR